MNLQFAVFNRKFDHEMFFLRDELSCLAKCLAYSSIEHVHNHGNEICNQNRPQRKTGAALSVRVLNDADQNANGHYGVNYFQNAAPPL
jgi:hypothetical protein